MNTDVMTGANCPFLLCLVAEPHTHPVCPDCGAVRYGNAFCGTCRELRGSDLNPHALAEGTYFIDPDCLVSEATDADKQLAEYRKVGAAELDAMHAAFHALAPLDYGSRCRALRWLGDRLDNRTERRGYDDEPPF